MITKNSEKHYSNWLTAGIMCITILIIASFLPGVADSKDYISIGSTWGFEYYKELTFLNRKTGIKSFVMAIYIASLIGGIMKCIKSKDHDEHIFILSAIAIMTTLLTVRTIDYSYHPSKLVFGYAKTEHAVVVKNDLTLRSDSNFIEHIDSMKKTLAHSLLYKQKFSTNTGTSYEDKTVWGIKVRKITFNRTYVLGEGFWTMFLALLILYFVIFNLKHNNT